MRDTTTHLLNRLSLHREAADSDIECEVFQRMQPQLKRIARRAMKRLRPRDPTADTTGVVDETFVRLSKQQLAWESREHYVTYATISIDRIVIDVCRRASAEKRGGHLQRVELNDQAIAQEQPVEFLSLLYESFELMKKETPRAHQIIWMYYIEGLTQSEISQRVGVSSATVTRDLRVGRAFLFNSLSNDGARIQT